MKFHVELLPQAQRNLDHILTRLKKQSPQGAENWHNRWIQLLDTLEASAEAFGRAPEDEDHEATIQQSTFKTGQGRRYRVLFTIRNNTVFVLHIRGPGQSLVHPDEMQLPN